MHELGIAQSLLDLVTREVAGRPGVRVTTVHLRVGELAGVEAEALGFAFDVLKPGTTCAGAALAVEPVGAAWVGGDLVAGTELDLTAIDLEVNDHANAEHP
jgi:hydrogenase nickel incorporation protein HypA/HybF